MSRENKLALIIGFALILFVGVLVSDHLSSHHREVTRELPTAIDPLRGAEAMPPVLVEYGRPYNNTPSTDTPALNVATTEQAAMQLHVVADSDTISSICRTWYGTSALAESLAVYNNLPDPDRLVTGMRLVIPAQALLTPASFDAPPPVVELAAAPEPAPVATQGTYTVQPGDTLSEIAQKLMGTSRATVALFEFNRAVLPDMDALQVGMQLHYPLPPS